MTKTLADMTAEERADCVGRWALIEGINLAVIVEVDETDTCVVIYPEWQSNTAVHLNEMVAPRFDLPRAWTPDGEPVPMKKELGFCGTAGLETIVHKYNSGTIYVPEDTPHGEVHRWVGEWEKNNEC